MKIPARKINDTFTLEKREKGFWASRNCIFSKDNDPIITLEKPSYGHGQWVAFVMDGPWCENQVYSVVGTWADCLKKLKEFSLTYSTTSI